MLVKTPSRKAVHKDGTYTRYIEVEDWQMRLVVVRWHGGFMFGREGAPTWGVYEADADAGYAVPKGNPLAVFGKRKDAMNHAQATLNRRFQATLKETSNA